MAEVTLTFCDGCNTEHDTGRARGWLDGVGEEEAIRDFDWKRTRRGVLCVECQDEIAAPSTSVGEQGGRG